MNRSKEGAIVTSTQIRNLPQVLSACNTEEEVKSEFAKAFKYKLDTRMRMDLYTNRILFEFKYDKSLESLNSRALALAQLMYYVRQIKYGNLDLKVPAYLCVVDKNEAFFIETSACKSVYDRDNSNFDWDRAASTPCPNISSALSGLKAVKDIHVYNFNQPEEFELFCSKLDYYGQEQPTLGLRH